MSGINGTNRSNKQNNQTKPSKPVSTDDEQDDVITDDTQKKVALMTFIVPIGLSIAFCFVDCWILVSAGSINSVPQAGEKEFWGIVLLIINKIFDVCLNYFPTTFISMIAAALFQQLYYKIPSGLKRSRIPGICFFFFIYTLIFATYSSLKNSELDWQDWAMFGLTVAFAVFMWTSLREEVREKAMLSTNKLRG